MSSIETNREPERWVADLSASGAAANAAFADLTEVITRGLRRALAGRGVSDTDLDDFVQESLIRIHQKLDAFRGDSKFTTWAIAISIRVALRIMQRVIQNDLTDRQRVVLLAALGGMPKESLAEELGLTSNALYKAAHDARKALKKRLTDEGIGENEVRSAFEGASNPSEASTR